MTRRERRRYIQRNAEKWMRNINDSLPSNKFVSPQKKRRVKKD